MTKYDICLTSWDAHSHHTRIIKIVHELTEQFAASNFIEISGYNIEMNRTIQWFVWELF